MAKRKSTFQKEKKKKKIQKPDEFKNQMNIDAHSSHA
jgi:hypothetical protein